MIDSGEAESRAVAGAVKGAIGQARLDAGVNIIGLLADLGNADGVDYRQHLMCWHLTRVLRPSLTEKVPPAVVRSVVDQETARSRTASLSHRSRLTEVPPSAGFQCRRWTPATSDTWVDECGDRAVPGGFTDTANVSSHPELCCTK